MSQLQIDPNLLADVYRDKLHSATTENALLTAGLNQVQQENAQLKQDNQILQQEVDKLTEHKSTQPE